MNVRKILKNLRKANGGVEYKSKDGKIYRRLKWLSHDKHWYFCAYVKACYENADGLMCADGAEIF